MAGAPSQQSASQFGAQMKNSRTLPYAWGSMAEGAGPGTEETKLLNSNLYPTRFLPSDDFDTEWMIRQQITEPAANMITPSRPMPWTEKEIDYLKRKRDAEEYANYNDWLVKKFPLNDPANRDILKRTVPRYFEERKQVLQEQIALSSKYANLRLFGPENEDDLKLQYAVETGRVKLPEGPFHDPVKWFEGDARRAGLAVGTNAEFMLANDELNRQTYEKGLFNPFSFLTWRNAPWGPNAKNMADSVGDSRARNLGPSGIMNPTNEDYGVQYRGPGLGDLARVAVWGANNGAEMARANQRTINAANPGVGRALAYEAFVADANNRTRWSNAAGAFV